MIVQPPLDYTSEQGAPRVAPDIQSLKTGQSLKYELAIEDYIFDRTPGKPV